jgi:hypothetical protein
VTGATIEPLEPAELKKLHRLGDDLAAATLTPDAGEPIRVAAAAEHRAALLGPYGATVTGA